MRVAAHPADKLTLLVVSLIAAADFLFVFHITVSMPITWRH